MKVVRTGHSAEPEVDREEDMSVLSGLVLVAANNALGSAAWRELGLSHSSECC